MGKQTLHTVLTRAFVTVVLVLQSAMWTRMLAPEGRGLYAKLQASQNFLTLFLGFGVTSGIVYFCSSRRASYDQLWSLSIATTICGSLVSGALVIVGYVWPRLDLIFPTGYGDLFFGLYFWLAFFQTQLQLAMNSFLAAEHRFANLNRIEIISSLFRLFLFALAFWVFRDLLTLKILFGLDFAACMLRTLFYSRYFRQMKLNVKIIPISWPTARPVIFYSFALYSLYVVQFLYQRIDVWIIERWSGLSALGVFSSAMGLAQYLTILPIALNTVLMPHMSRSSRDEAYVSLVLFSRINTTVLLAPVLIFVFFPKVVLLLMFGPSFVTGARSLTILGLAYWLTAEKHILIYFNASQNRLRSNFIIEATGLAVGLGLNFWWVPRYGIDGAAYAFLATGMLTAALSFISVQRYATDRIANLFLLTFGDLRVLRERLIKGT